MTAIEILDTLGVFVFAISGALVAVRKEMDFFGMLVLASLPAVGGGTSRDLILDVPVFWLSDASTVIAISAAVLVVFFGHKYIRSDWPLLKWADAVGLSIFCVLGCQKALDVGVTGSVAVMMGVITAVAGGVIRDVVANEVPYVLRQEIYATAAMVGAIGFLVAEPLTPEWSVWIGIAAALAVRGAGIVWGLSLPKMYRGGD